MLHQPEDLRRRDKDRKEAESSRRDIDKFRQNGEGLGPPRLNNSSLDEIKKVLLPYLGANSQRREASHRPSFQGSN